MSNPFDFLYKPTGIKALGEYYKPPKQFKHGEKTLVAKLPRSGDGHDVEVYETRLPATFFELRFKGMSIRTGTVDAEFICQLAVEIQNGMVDADSLFRDV